MLLSEVEGRLHTCPGVGRDYDKSPAFSLLLEKQHAAVHDLDSVLDVAGLSVVPAKSLGAYDLMSILEAADDESVTAFTLALSSLGNVRMTTMRAFDTAEMREIVAAHRTYI